ncbi:hypothetical protein [Marinomonas algarum]|uniref:Lipoprotein n=1 Tax=Marinomonas algarum TaxID=2883105 RepID=A0A9X1LEL1_9GAMM|nr:hypothetical protein [Marinomonas algarum]MCB5161623.1 hypothetical protein [Marinomonas algarum]
MTFFTFKMRIFCLFCLLSVLSGCDSPADDLSQLSNAELRIKWRHCAYLDNPSSSQQTRCDRYEKACQQRKQQGNLACY